MKNKVNLVAIIVEIIGIATILLNLTGILFAGLFLGTVVLALGIVALIREEKKIYCYLMMLIGILTMITPIVLFMRAFS